MKKFVTVTVGLCLFFAWTFSQTNRQHTIYTTNNDEQMQLRRFDSVVVLENKSETSANGHL